MHVEDETINLHPIIQNRNAYPREENSCGYYSSMVILDDHNLHNNVILDNTDIRSNNIPENIDLVLSYLHISGTKYRNYRSKIDTVTNIKIQK